MTTLPRETTAPALRHNGAGRPSNRDLLNPTDHFVDRHLGSNEAQVRQMLAALGLESLDALINATIPHDIRMERPLNLEPPRSESEILAELRAIQTQLKPDGLLIGDDWDPRPDSPHHGVWRALQDFIARRSREIPAVDALNTEY